MSPDIEWRVGEDAEQETIAQVTSRSRRSRHSRWAVIGAIGLGVGLGLLYRSIPEPPPKPIGSTPAPTIVPAPSRPLPAPESLDAAIQRDALRLSSLNASDGVIFDPSLSRMPQAYADWYAALQNAQGRWGPGAYQTLYTVFASSTLPSGVAWVNLGQFRDGDFFRQTRFYRLENDHWIWTLPDLAFWSGKSAEVSTGDAAAIGPVTIVHPLEDAPVIGAVFERFTRAYLNLCERLNCPSRPDFPTMWTPGLALNITIQPALTQADVHEGGRTALYIDLPSPRVVGYFEDANTPGDPYVAMAYAGLIDPIVRLASGDGARWEIDHRGELFLQAVATWERLHLQEELHPSDLFFPPAFSPPVAAQGLNLPRESYPALLRNEALVPLLSLWDWPDQGGDFGMLQDAAVNEAESVVVFIDERYGADRVVRFLNALGRAHSLDEAIETALPVSFGEFNRQWMRWISGE